MTTNTVYATRDIEKAAGDVQTYAMSFAQALNGRTISSVDSITVSPSGPSLSGEQVNASAYYDDHTKLQVAANTAVKYVCSGGTAGTTYVVTITVTLSDGSTLVGKQNVSVL